MDHQYHKNDRVTARIEDRDKTVTILKWLPTKRGYMVADASGYQFWIPQDWILKRA